MHARFLITRHTTFFSLLLVVYVSISRIYCFVYNYALDLSGFSGVYVKECELLALLFLFDSVGAGLNKLLYNSVGQDR